ncbi:MAG: hypothetical protein U0236_17130 [Nitrospira sp.]
MGDWSNQAVQITYQSVPVINLPVDRRMLSDIGGVGGLAGLV